MALPFQLTRSIDTNFQFKIASINFNNATFQKSAGYDEHDFARRVSVLAQLVKKLAQDGVVIINLQELSSRFMNVETLRYQLLTKLFEVDPSWTATNPFLRHGDAQKCFSLMTLWNSNVLHLNSATNFHFSEGEPRDVGDQLCADQNIVGTSNALITDFSLTYPAQPSQYHTGGPSIDNRAKVLNVNVHLPIRGPLKIQCLSKLFQYLKFFPNSEDYFTSVCGDFNVFKDEPESVEMIRQMEEFGRVGALNKCGNYYYETLGGQLRSTSFVGMIYDLKNFMKLVDAEQDPDKYQIWVDGQYQPIKDTFNKQTCPLDWLIFKDQPWCREISTKVIDIEDQRKLLSEEFKSWLEITPQVTRVPDYGNFLTDHLPLVSTIQYIGNVSKL
jgi:hypothetical protein